jgi:hypothetical protein
VDVKMKRKDPSGADPTLSYTALVIIAAVLLAFLIKLLMGFLRVPLP